MRGLSAIFNILTLLALAATAVVALGFVVLLAVPGAVPSFLRVATQPPQVAAITPVPLASATTGLAYPTLPPEWTATPSPQPSATSTATPLDTDTPTATAGPSLTPTSAASLTPTPTATSANVVSVSAQANIRSGPSTAYPVIYRPPSSLTATALGRDSAGQWLSISIEGAPGGTGWVSTLAAKYSGNISDLPVVQPAGPPPTPAATHTPSAPPTNTGVPNINGIQASFNMHKTTGIPGESIFFTFTVVNITNSNIIYGILAAHTDQGYTADSWHDPLLPGKSLTWDDHINFSVAGTYQVYLGICYASHDACKTGGAPWTRLSPSTAVTIQ
jgi:hypothetical protein